LIVSHKSFGIFAKLKELKFKEARWLLKLRGELLFLRFKPWLWNDPDEESCLLCNLNKREDLFHFLSECPILGEVRRLYFGSLPVTADHIIAALSGQADCRSLLAFVAHAWRVRWDWLFA